MDILIRNLTKDFLETRVSEFIGILADEPAEYWDESHFLMPLPEKFTLSIVAMAGNTVAGYIIASLKESGPYIHKFMVRNEFRGKSTGTALLNFFEKNISNKRFFSIKLSVREGNDRAIKFYLNKGFKKTGRRTDPSDNSGLVIMEKVIDQSGSAI